LRFKNTLLKLKNSFVILILACCCSLSAQPLTAPRGADVSTWQKDKYPSVFLIGEYSNAFEALSRSHNTPLINACDEDMEIAFSKWVDMMMALETYSEEEGYDIRGVKMWIKIFWAADGAVEHIAYFLKPQSRNISTKKLSDFFKGFIRTYKLPLEVERSFSHYGSVSFPTHYRLIKP